MSATAAAHRERTAFIGMAIFIASWAMLFCALFFAYGLVRLRAPAWPPADLPRLPRALPALATAALALSSLALERRRVLVAAGLGALFLGCQIVAWRALWAGGLVPNTGTYASAFYMLTVFHALHVAVGLFALVALALRRVRSTGLRLWTLYWHMVGVIWGVMFTLVYVL